MSDNPLRDALGLLVFWLVTTFAMIVMYRFLEVQIPATCKPFGASGQYVVCEVNRER